MNVDIKLFLCETCQKICFMVMQGGICCDCSGLDSGKCIFCDARQDRFLLEGDCVRKDVYCKQFNFALVNGMLKYYNAETVLGIERLSIELGKDVAFNIVKAVDQIEFDDSDGDDILVVFRNILCGQLGLDPVESYAELEDEEGVDQFLREKVLDSIFPEPVDNDNL
jgi:hypothetical protein